MRNRLLNTLLIAAIGIVSLNSCTGMLYTSIDVLRPAKLSFDKNTENLLIVNNAAVQPSTVGHQTWLLNDSERTVDVATDSLAMLMVSALSEEIAAKNFFASNQLIYENQNTSSDYKIAKPLRSYQVATFSSNNKSDIVLSLNKLNSTSLLDEFYYQDYMYALSLNAIYDSEWSLQYPDRAQIDTVQFTDTIYWGNASASRRLLFENFPRRSDALKNGALEVGRKMVDRFIPYWEECDRYLFDLKDKQMKQGMDSVYNKKWTGAITIWENALPKFKSGKEVAYTSNNLAVAYEITGNIDKALEYINAAIETYSKKASSSDKHLIQMRLYQNDLLLRRKEMPLIEKQLGK